MLFEDMHVVFLVMYLYCCSSVLVEVDTFLNQPDSVGTSRASIGMDMVLIQDGVLPKR